MSCGDKALICIGYGGAVIYGSALPAFCVLFGGMIDNVGEQDYDGSTGMNSMDMLKFNAIFMVIAGVVLWFAAGGQQATLSIFAESISYKVKINYFRKCLEQDATFYDSQNPTEMASKISRETTAIQRGIGEKAGQIL